MRFLAWDNEPGSTSSPQHWPLGEIKSLRSSLQGGVGTLEAASADRRLGHWRFTAALEPDADRLVQAFKTARLGVNAPSGGICPGCGEPFPPGTTTCPTCAPSAIPPPSRSLARLIPFAQRRAGLIVLGFALTTLSTAAGLVPPYLTQQLLDKVLIPQQLGQGTVDVSQATYYLGGMALAAVVAWLISWGRTYVMAWVSELISADIRKRTYSHLQQLSLEFFGGKRTGDLISRVGSDSDRICNFLSVNLVDFTSDVLMLLMTAGVLVFMNWKLALITLAPLPIIAFVVQRIRDRMRNGFERSYRAWGEMVSVLTDTIPGIRVVKAFAQEQREVERFEQGNQRVVQSNDQVNRLWSFFSPMIALLTEVGLLVVWLFGAWQVFRGEITVGVLTAFVAYIGRFYARLESMSRILAATQRAAAATHRIFEILDRQPSVAEPVKPHVLGPVRGHIELRGVKFSYGPRQVIKGVDIDITPGEMIGLVGPSGAGKTTLVNLICRFFDPAEGTILLDGVDIRSFPVSAYRKNIGIVLQEPFLFFGTVAENIAYGKPEATREEIIAAARAAGAHDFILRLVDGYDSLVGERGQSLSGGERQRISIARALLIDPRILILDEATSSVDNETEREIQEALDVLIRGRTTIAIAHRLSTLRKADRLVVVEGGRVAEVGKHQELLDRDGTYARLHRAQQELAQSVGI